HGDVAGAIARAELEGAVDVGNVAMRQLNMAAEILGGLKRAHAVRRRDERSLGNHRRGAVGGEVDPTNRLGPSRRSGVKRRRLGRDLLFGSWCTACTKEARPHGDETSWATEMPSHCRPNLGLEERRSFHELLKLTIGWSTDVHSRTDGASFSGLRGAPRT